MKSLFIMCVALTMFVSYANSSPIKIKIWLNDVEVTSTVYYQLIYNLEESEIDSTNQHIFEIDSCCAQPNILIVIDGKTYTFYLNAKKYFDPSGVLSLKLYTKRKLICENRPTELSSKCKFLVKLTKLSGEGDPIVEVQCFGSIK